MSRLPDFVIVGAMKCATSTLHDQLAAQPGIFMSRPKEPNYFSDDDVFARGQGWYQDLFAAAVSSDLCGESSTHYSKLPSYPHTVDRLYRCLPRVKVIYVMRHPIDRLVSHYIHQWTEREITIPIDDAVDRYPTLINYSRYAMQLEPYVQAYGKTNIMPVFFERMVSRPDAELERICQFIGFRGRPEWHAPSETNNASNQRLRKSRIRDAFVWNPVSTWLRRRFVPQGWRDAAKRPWQMTNRPKLSHGQVARLTTLLDEDLAVLGDWLGMDLTCDDFKTQVMRIAPEWQQLPCKK